MNNAVFAKFVENVRKHRDIKVVTQKEEKTIWCQNQIIILQIFSRTSVSNRNEENADTMNKPVYLGLSILELSKIIIMYEFWYDYSKPKYGKKVRYIKYIKTDDINKDIAEDVKARFDTSNYELDRKFPKEKNKKK